MNEEMAKYLDDNLWLIPRADVPVPEPVPDDVVRDPNAGDTVRFRRYEQLPVGTDWNYKWWVDEDG